MLHKQSLFSPGNGSVVIGNVLVVKADAICIGYGGVRKVIIMSVATETYQMYRQV